MKEIMIPYILIMWVLVSTGALKWTMKTAFWAITGGAVILYILLLMSRFWAPADLTNSTTVKAPHAVMSRLIGEQIKDIYVTHNQFVKKDDVLYTLVDINSAADLAKIDVDIIKQKEVIVQMERDLKRSKISPEIFNERDIEKFTSDLKIAKAVIISLKADRQKVEWAQEKKNVTAQFDGQVSTVNIAHGGTIGNMHLYDTGRKFLEMRIPDHIYSYVEPGNFAEFYVDAYPGEIFRAKVHSFTAGTGEASVSPINGPQSVTQHVGRNMGTHGRTIILEIFEPEGKHIPIGATGSAWISAKKPHPFWGFIDVIGGATVRLHSYKAYLNAW